MNNSSIIILLIGFALDCILGDPQWLPHPIRAFGWSISKFEKRFNSGKNKTLKGAFISIFLIAFTYGFFFIIKELSSVNSYLEIAIGSVFVFYGLANRSLIAESLKVEKELSKNGLDAGRKQLSYIVGRETQNLNENQIRTAILETLAENLSDGVIAPLFFYSIGGFPAMMAYKMANTLDSMIGYKSEGYKQFGMFAAKFDDITNFIPARITAVLMCIVTLSWRGIAFIFKYGRKHSSPNAGLPEAALAGILNCRFGGPNYYHGTLVNKPFIGNNHRDITTKDLHKTTIINTGVTILSIIIITFCSVL